MASKGGKGAKPSKNKAAWDDGELVTAFDRAVDKYIAVHKGRLLEEIRAEDEAIEKNQYETPKELAPFTPVEPEEEAEVSKEPTKQSQGENSDVKSQNKGQNGSARKKRKKKTQQATSNEEATRYKKRQKTDGAPTNAEEQQDKTQAPAQEWPTQATSGGQYDYNTAQASWGAGYNGQAYPQPPAQDYSQYYNQWYGYSNHPWGQQPGTWQQGQPHQPPQSAPTTQDSSDDEELPNAPAQHNAPPSNQYMYPPHPHHHPHPPAPHMAPPMPPPMPTQDPALKNLLLSFYYSGYYAGQYSVQKGNGTF